jgi:hypothetical protein
LKSVETDQLEKINRFALTPLSPGEVFVARFLLAHNMIDRDHERFPEKLLDDFSKTLPGKSLLDGHNKQKLPSGLFFDSITEEMNPAQFTVLTNEAASLPDNIHLVKVLWGWIYMVRSEINAEMIKNIIAGIYRHVSIGFRASELIPIKGQYEQILYWEYVPPGEALEGSIVWLGAQPGATIKTFMNTSDQIKEGSQGSPVDCRKKNLLIPDDDEGSQTDDKGKECVDCRKKNLLVPEEN